jgi:hypothetical protein
VLLLTVVLVVFVIVAPNAPWSRGLALAIEVGAFLVVVATSSERARTRRAHVLAGAATGIVVVIAVAAGVVSQTVSSLAAGALALAIPLALGGGLVRLVRDRGVTLQAVAGALAVYLLVGLMFASVIGVVAKLGDQPYFTQGTDGSESTRLYFSFTVLTTTGFGDYTAAGPAGRALAVVEMLTGQLYLVTVIGVLVGGLVSRRQA